MTTKEHTGGCVNYYLTEVKHPVRGGPGYKAECLDIIEALKMNPHEANIFKAIWRRAAERQGLEKQGNNQFYDAEKIEFFGNYLANLERIAQGKSLRVLREPKATIQPTPVDMPMARALPQHPTHNPHGHGMRCAPEDGMPRSNYGPDLAAGI